jgi:hypothetical protein
MKNKRLWLGDFVNVRILLEVRHDVLTLPTTAIRLRAAPVPRERRARQIEAPRFRPTVRRPPARYPVSRCCGLKATAHRQYSGAALGNENGTDARGNILGTGSCLAKDIRHNK